MRYDCINRWERKTRLYYYLLHLLFLRSSAGVKVHQSGPLNLNKKQIVSESNNIRIHHECEGGIEKSVPKITDWHHEACRVMKNGDREGRIFLSHPHMNNGFFFLLTTKYLILYWKNMKKTYRKSWIQWDATWWGHFNITKTSEIDVWLFVFYLSHGLVQVCEIELSHMGKNNGNQTCCARTPFPAFHNTCLLLSHQLMNFDSLNP